MDAVSKLLDIIRPHLISFLSYLKSTRFKVTLKATVALFIVSLLCIIPYWQRTLDSTILLTLGPLLMDFHGHVGTILKSCLLIVFGTLCGAISTITIVCIYNVTSEGFAILAILMPWMFLFSCIRGKWVAEMNAPMVVAMLIAVVGSVSVYRYDDMFDFEEIVKMCWQTLIGASISLLCIIIIWPTTAVGTLTLEMNKSLVDVYESYQRLPLKT
jgi:hypothetical protein